MDDVENVKDASISFICPHPLQNSQYMLFKLHVTFSKRLKMTKLTKLTQQHCERDKILRKTQ